MSQENLSPWIFGNFTLLQIFVNYLWRNNAYKQIKRHSIKYGDKDRILRNRVAKLTAKAKNKLLFRYDGSDEFTT